MRKCIRITYHAACTLTKQDNTLRVTTESSDVSLNPLQRRDLVAQTKVQRTIGGRLRALGELDVVKTRTSLHQYQAGIAGKGENPLQAARSGS